MLFAPAVYWNAFLRNNQLSWVENSSKERKARPPSLVAQRLKRLPPIQETRVQSLGREDTLAKEMVTHSSILAWRIPWTEKSGRLQSMGSQRVGHDWATSLTSLTAVWEWALNFFIPFIWPNHCGGPRIMNNHFKYSIVTQWFNLV